jgi:hypothetical protein
MVPLTLPTLSIKRWTRTIGTATRMSPRSLAIPRAPATNRRRHLLVLPLERT